MNDTRLLAGDRKEETGLGLRSARTAASPSGGAALPFRHVDPPGAAPAGLHVPARLQIGDLLGGAVRLQAVHAWLRNGATARPRRARTAS